MMIQILHLILLMPLIGFAVSILIPEHEENLMSKWTFGMIGFNFLLLLSFVVVWLIHGAEATNFKDWSLFQSDGYNFFIDFYFDKVTNLPTG